MHHQRGLARRALLSAETRVFFSSTASSSPSWFSSLWDHFRHARAEDTTTSRSRVAVLVDGNNLLHLNYNRNARKKSNLGHVGGALGALEQIMTALEKYDPDRVCVFFDTVPASLLKEVLASSKSMHKQHQLLIQTLQRYNVAVVQEPGVKADDLIASYTKASTRAGLNVVVVSHDNDFYPLAQDGPPRVDLFLPVYVPAVVFDAGRIQRRLGPALPWYADVIALCGDKFKKKSPGVPGGIARPDAVALISKHGGLLPLLDRLDEMENEDLRERIKINADVIKAAYVDIKLIDDLALPAPLETMAASRIDIRGLWDVVHTPSLFRKR
ncbi:Aste57867_12840 [Aphanomyces stellatus]|uniref:Aste57867_12840 protein n=1 Tax=Aphanomyces stellatus TaxID=120398 RepID=A0A485KWN5_9STRA|nr:hypothetical protein As57867_012792 [Aphanomyces stellatus]VFT89687.1 Aste57867_12840 [Aphanomyces stellatus]